MGFSEWRKVKLGDIVDTISQKHKFDTDKIVLVNTSDVLEGKALNHKYVTNKNLKGQFKKSFQKHDILYSEIRPQNKRFAYIDFDSKDYVASTKLMVLRKKNNNITSDFLYQILKSGDIINKLQVIAESRSGTFPQITFAELSRLDILLPPIDEQRAIADTLSCLDNKIELNNRINKTLEEMAQAIFKSWFVDFEPFQDGEFEDSELGRIPKGWHIFNLSEIFEINPSRTIPRGTIAPYLDMSNVPTRGHAPNNWIEREIGSGMKFINGDTLVARITPCLENGKTAYVDFLEDGQVGWGSTEYIILRPRSPISTVFAYILARSDRFRDYAIKRMTGSSGRQRVPADNIGLFKIVLPPLEHVISKRFAVIIKSLFNSMRISAQESRTLNQIRDSLLLKLMSGKIRVPVEEVQ
ncbi:MAG: restriction endonuclease subunit S [Desulfotomaculaceae bacterium]